MKNLKILFTIISLVLFMSSANAQCGNNHTSQNTRTYKTSNYSHDKDIVSLAASNKHLSTLVAAVKAAGLVETLQGKGPFTVFAPTNEAFAALPKGTVESLLKPENKDKLIKVLTYHVVSGRVEASDLSDGQNLKSVEGQKIKVELSGQTVKINNALVKSANNRTGNGVVHIIDRVILPPNL